MTKYKGINQKIRQNVNNVQTSLHHAVRKYKKSEPLEPSDPFEYSMEIEKCLVEVVDVRQRYFDLEESYGPSPSTALPALEALILRPPRFQEKHLPQEYSLLHKLWMVFGGNTENSAVIDIGAGNGCLALLTSVVLGSYAVCIDCASPPPEMRAEKALPASMKDQVVRIEANIGDVDLQEIGKLLADKGVKKVAVVAKHLCGVGTDLAIQFLEKLKDILGGAVVGTVMATCCGHKINGDDLEQFEALHRQDQPWNEFMQDHDERREFIGTCCKYVSWRTTKGSDQHPTMTALATLFEDLIQAPRWRKLGALFPTVQELCYIQSTSSPQNRCLVAHQGVECGDFCEYLLKRSPEFLQKYGRLDVRPKGIVSVKYDYDGNVQ